jgi:hypothetical protein
MKLFVTSLVFGLCTVLSYANPQAIPSEYLEPAEQCLALTDNEQRLECYRNIRIIMRANGEESPLLCERSLPSEFLECADRIVSEGIVSLKQTNDFFEPRVYHGSSSMTCKSTFSNSSSNFSCTDGGKTVYESTCYYNNGDVKCISKVGD